MAKPSTPPKKHPRCEVCGAADASPSRLQVVFDAAIPGGRRPRMLCRDAAACYRRLHTLMAAWGTMKFNTETRQMEHRLNDKGRETLKLWSAQRHRGAPPF